MQRFAYLFYTIGKNSPIYLKDRGRKIDWKCLSATGGLGGGGARGGHSGQPQHSRLYCQNGKAREAVKDPSLL